MTLAHTDTATKRHSRYMCVRSYVIKLFVIYRILEECMDPRVL